MGFGSEKVLGLRVQGACVEGCSSVGKRKGERSEEPRMGYTATDPIGGKLMVSGTIIEPRANWNLAK